MSDPGKMIDISDKNITVRTAEASGSVVLWEDAFKVLTAGECPKGNVLETAKIAAIQAAKQTPSIVPMCHAIMLDTVNVDFRTDTEQKTVCVYVQAKASAKTGVEMEALTAVSTACLTIYDMLKFKGRDMEINEVKLLSKTGGKSGDYEREEG